MTDRLPSILRTELREVTSFNTAIEAAFLPIPLWFTELPPDHPRTGACRAAVPASAAPGKRHTFCEALCW